MQKKQNSRKARPQSEPALPTDFTPGQLILAICIVLVAALVCFSMGILVGRYTERSSRPEQTRTTEPAGPKARELPPVTKKPTPEPKAPGEGIQETPRRVKIPTRPMLSEPSALPTTSGGPPKRSATRIAEHPAPPKPEPAAKPQLPELPTPPQRPSETKDTRGPVAPGPRRPDAAATPVTTPAEAPADTPKGTPEDAARELTPATEPVDFEEPVALEPLSVEPSKPEEPKAPPQPTGTAKPPAHPEETRPTAGRPPKGAYSIQVASFSGAHKEQLAADFKKRLEAQGEFKSELVLSEDGKYLRVVVGSYPDRETARAACGELRKRPGFADCFVKQR